MDWAQLSRAGTWVVVFSLLSVAQAPLAHADPFHHQPLPMGQRALGMGGAFTGLANDPSAAFYNPAGLARIEETALSASLSLAAFDRLDVDGGYQTVAGNSDLRYGGRPSLPLFVAIARQVGRRDAQRVRHHAIAISTFTLDDRSLSLDTRRFRTDADGRQQLSTLYSRHDQSMRWYGLSYAYRLLKNYSLGISTFLSHSKASTLDERLDLSLSPGDAMDGQGTDPNVRFNSVRVSQDSKSMVVRLAFMYFGEKVRVGGMFQPPSLHFKGNAKVRDRLVTSNASTAGMAQGSYVEPTNSHLPARDPLPWEIRGGVAYLVRPNLVFDFDLSVDGKGSNVRLPWAFNTAGKFTTSNQTTSLSSPSYERVPTVNTAVGTEYDFRGKVKIQGGLFTDLTAAPRLPAESVRQRPDHIHRFGASFSVGFGTNGYDLAVGTVARVGLGSALVPSGDETGIPYLRADAREHTLFVFLTGARSAVAKLADAAIDLLNERREDNPPKKAHP